jgi:hypothetical protein
VSHCVVLENCVLSENSHYEYCLIEKVNETLKIHSFRAELFEEHEELIER